MHSQGPLARVVILGVIGGAYWAGYALSILEYSDFAALAVGWGVPIYIAFWAETDARTFRYWPAFHYAWYLIGFWPITVPHYIFRTRGTQGIPLLVLLLILLTHWLWGYWLGIFTGWILGWYSGDDVLELLRSAG